MIKGLALTPPVIGRISIGKVVEKNGKRLPEKDDEFTLTSQVQQRDGWVPHPLDDVLRKTLAPSAGSGAPKLRSLPVRLLFNDPGLNLRAHYSLFDRDSGRPVCVGNGESCRRWTLDGLQSLTCPTPAGCELAHGGRCKPYGRLHVRLDVEPAGDDLGTFILRTTGVNSIRTLATRLQYVQAASGGLLAWLPLELRLRGKSTTASHRAPIYYVDLTPRAGQDLAQAIQTARRLQQEQQAAGVDQDALDEAARQGYAQGAFEESEEDGPAVVEEFYPSADPMPEPGPASVPMPGARPTLASKLGQRVAQQAGRQAPLPAATPP